MFDYQRSGPIDNDWKESSNLVKQSMLYHNCDDQTPKLV